MVSKGALLGVFRSILEKELLVSSWHIRKYRKYLRTYIRLTEPLAKMSVEQEMKMYEQMNKDFIEGKNVKGGLQAAGGAVLGLVREQFLPATKGENIENLLVGAVIGGDVKALETFQSIARKTLFPVAGGYRLYSAETPADVLSVLFFICPAIDIVNTKVSESINLKEGLQ